MGQFSENCRWRGHQILDIPHTDIATNRLNRRRSPFSKKGIAERPQRDHRRTTEEPQKDHRGTTEGPQRNHRRTTEEPQVDHRRITEGPQRDHSGTTEGPQRKHRRKDHIKPAQGLQRVFMVM